MYELCVAIIVIVCGIVQTLHGRFEREMRHERSKRYREEAVGTLL
jgi:hypothetical protein